MSCIGLIYLLVLTIENLGMKTIKKILKKGLISGVYVFLLFVFPACQKTDVSKTIFKGYIRNKITNEPLKNVSIVINTVAHGGGGILIYNNTLNLDSRKVVVSTFYFPILDVITTSFIKSSSSQVGSNIDETSTFSDSTGYFSVESSSEVVSLSGSCIKNDVSVDFIINNFLQDAENTVNYLIDCPANFYPVLKSNTQYSSNDSMGIWIANDQFDNFNTLPLTQNGYLIGKYPAGGAVKVINSAVKPYADRYVKYVIGYYHNLNWNYKTDSVFLKSFTTYRDTITIQ